MPRLIVDLSGGRYGLLTVVAMAGRHPVSGAVLWQCRCRCGATTVVPSNVLRADKMRHCGCQLPKMLATMTSAQRGMTKARLKATESKKWRIRSLDMLTRIGL